jgi:hypothetical protein
MEQNISIPQTLSRIRTCLALNEIQSLKDKLELAINERRLTVPAKNVQILEIWLKRK